MVGSDAYWNVIAPESFASASLTSYRAHDNFWTETWTNFLSNGYFGKSWIGPIGKYPIQNISSFNMCRLRTAQILGLMRMMVKQGDKSHQERSFLDNGLFLVVLIELFHLL